MILKATFLDDTEYTSSADDTSQFTEGKNAFYDILQRISEVSTFSILKESNTYTVDLRTGKFSINNIEFWAQDQFIVPVGKLSLIYFKEMHQRFRLGEDSPYEIKCNRYFIGWEDENKNKSTISIQGE